ncbi:MAG TPA: DinB family protein [Bacillales bacterium]|nr:DinB family protein [Bacillales bacterium]
MNEEALFAQLRMSRRLTLAALKATPEAIADKQPGAFNNSLRWNFGHIYVSLNGLMYGFAGEEDPSPEGYKEWFDRGTSPEDWGDAEMPSLARLQALLEAQPELIEERFTGRLEERTERPFGLIKTGRPAIIGDLLNFGIYHEGLHLGWIHGLKRALGEKQLYAE